VREALKRLAAQSLIRTQRGAFGGAFVNRLSYEDAYNQQITTSTLLLSMNGVSFDVACEARFAMERACARLAAAAQRRSPGHDARRDPPPGAAGADRRGVLRLGRGVSPGVGGWRGQPRPVLPAGRRGRGDAAADEHDHLHARSREEIVALHGRIADAAEARDAARVTGALEELEAYTITLARSVLAERAAHRNAAPGNGAPASPART
jgi:GntR family transcriptional repressor for pyruvate dehydrogenase complex